MSKASSVVVHVTQAKSSIVSDRVVTENARRSHEFKWYKTARRVDDHTAERIDDISVPYRRREHTAARYTHTDQ